MLDKRLLIAGAGIVLMVGGLIVDSIKKKQDVGVVKQENRVPSPPIAKPEPIPEPETIPISKQESETKPEVKLEKSIEVIRADEKEAVLKINGKVYVYSKAGNKEVKEKTQTKKVKKNEVKNEVKTKEEENRQEEQIGSSIAIVCRADGKDCSLYEGTKVHRVGDGFMGAKIKNIEIDKVYLDDGRIIILE